MKRFVFVLSFAGLLGSVQAGKIDFNTAMPWEDALVQWATPGSYGPKKTRKEVLESLNNPEERRMRVRSFADNVYGSIAHAGYSGADIISIPLDGENRRQPIRINREDTQDFLQAMHTHFAQELGDFKVGGTPGGVAISPATQQKLQETVDTIARGL